MGCHAPHQQAPDNRGKGHPTCDVQRLSAVTPIEKEWLPRLFARCLFARCLACLPGACLLGACLPGASPVCQVPVC